MRVCAAIDIRLNWTSEFDERVLINPSILWWGATLVRAARAHRKSCLTSVGTYRHQTVLNVTTVWESDIVLRHSTWSRSRRSPSDAEVSALRGWNVSDWDLGDEELTRLNMTIGGHPWGIPCAASPSYYTQNATLHSTIVTGPEDPKIMQFGSGFPQLVFSSLPSRSYDASCGASASFPSGLALPPNSGKIVVTYGVADMQGRTLVMSTSYVSTLFNWCTPDLARALANRRTVPAEPPALDGHASTREQRGRWSLTWLLILLASVAIPCAYYIGAVAAGVQRPRVELKLGEVLKSKPSKPALTALPAFPFRMSTNVIRKDLKPAELKPKVPKHKRTRKIPRKGRHKFEILPDEDAEDRLQVHEDYELDHAKAEEEFVII